MATTEENEQRAVAIHAALKADGVFAPILNEDEIVTTIWTALDKADGNP